MEGATHPSPSAEALRPPACLDSGQPSPFSQQRVTISKQEHIDLVARASYWEAQHARAKSEIDKLRQEVLLKDAKIKDLQSRLFGKKSEKSKPLKSEKGGQGDSPSKRKRGQQPGSQGHGRTKRPDLPVIDEQSDLAEDEKRCPSCGLEHLPRPALDEHSDVIEVEVKAHTRRIRRLAYTRNPGCTCEGTPAILTAAPPARLIPRSDYGVSFWVDVILSKYRYGQPSHRFLQDLADQGLPVSPGTLAGGLQAIAPLFEPVLEALYCKQMSEQLFHNDETRWEVFVELPGKVGTRWYLWVTRSPSVVFYCIDPSRSAAVPGAHFAGRKNYYGSGSIWSAQLAATLFAILQTLGLWGINPRHWLTCYLSACAENGASPPADIDPFLPWAMDETRRAALSRPYPCRAPPGAPAEPPAIGERA